MMKRFNTMCEFWTLKQSHNHVMMGSVDAWFYKELAGIQLLEEAPAYKQFIVRPYPAEGLDHARASVETIRGTVASGWTKTRDAFELKVQVPFNCSARVHVPANRNTVVNEGDMEASDAEGVTSMGHRNGYHAYSVQSGTYTFSCRQ